MKIRAWLRTGTRQVHDGTCARFQCGNRPTLTATVDLPTPRALGPQQAAEVELRPLEPDQ